MLAGSRMVRSPKQSSTLWLQTMEMACGNNHDRALSPKRTDKPRSVLAAAKMQMGPVDERNTNKDLQIYQYPIAEQQHM
eukprot:5599602-Amphidinium_carterae.1